MRQLASETQLIESLTRAGWTVARHPADGFTASRGPIGVWAESLPRLVQALVSKGFLERRT